MKQSFSFFVIFLFFSFTLFSQDFEPFVFDDGTVIEIKNISTDPDNGRKTSIFFGSYYTTQQLSFIGANYHSPGKFYVNAQMSLRGAVIDGNYFFKTKLKDKELKQSVKYTGGAVPTKYVARIPAKMRVSYGVHLGTEFFGNSFVGDEPLVIDQYFNGIGIIAGVSMLKTRHGHLQIKSNYKKRRGSSISRLSLDAVYYVKRSLIDNDISIDPDEDVDDYIRKMTVRLYYDGKASIWSANGRFSLNYALGIGLSPNKTEKVPISGIFGLGFGYNF